MTLKSLNLSLSTLGFLKKNSISYGMLLENRDDLTQINGIGPGRASEILLGLERAEGAKASSAPPEPRTKAPEPEPALPEKPETPGVPFVEPGGLVVYTDPSGNRQMSRVAAKLEAGKLNLQVFTARGGAHRVETVRYGENGERGSWQKAVEE